VIYTTRQECEARLGRPLTAAEDAVFDATARDASAYLSAVAPRIPTTLPVPDGVVGVASWLTISAMASPPGSAAGVASEALGGYSVVYRSDSDSGMFTLTQGMRAALAPWMKPRIGTVKVDPTTVVAWGGR
jgi:hypothetical protein